MSNNEFIITENTEDYIAVLNVGSGNIHSAVYYEKNAFLTVYYCFNIGGQQHHGVFGAKADVIWNYIKQHIIVNIQELDDITI